MRDRVLWRPKHNSSAHEKNGAIAIARSDPTATSNTTNDQNYIQDDELEFHRIRHMRLDEILIDRNNGNHNHNDGGDNNGQSSQSLIVTKPPHRPLVELVNQNLVVGQEVALTTILLAVHREIVVYEDLQEQQKQDHNSQNEQGNSNDFMSQKSSLAMLIVYATLFLIVYYNRQSSSIDSQGKRQQRRKKAIVRLSDGLFLAVLLRFISGVLRSLTASYSTDTVYALAISGMTIHLLACDYGYANGILFDDGTEEGGGNSSAPTTSNATSEETHPRPAFLGGTVSLNAAFFSTVLLISRIKSNVTSYAFVSSVVTLFAFYPASRHNIAGSFPNTIWGSPCFLITIALSVASWLLLSSFERILFASLQLVVFVLSPCLQWFLQRYKQFITGPWDIAHIQTQT